MTTGIATAQEPAKDGSGPSLRELLQTQYNTNLFGAVVCVDTFLPLLRKSKGPLGKRIAFTSSGLASLEWAQPGASFPGKQPELYVAGRYPLYRSTKTAMSMIVVHYAAVLGEEGFVVSSADPGYCKFSR
jgi:NAD(P)-dependent dehydrogenase (short-subunit alcohol dehydrogenase family)